MFHPDNQRQLAQWLHHNSIDTSSWGSNGAKSIENLWDEIQRGESILLDNPPRRVVYVTQVWIRQGELLLIEMSQTLDDGSTRQVDTLPSEKMHPGETPRQTALRCLYEELQILPEEATIADEQIESWQEEKPAFSYPGLQTRYSLYRVPTAVGGLPPHPFTTREMHCQNGDPVVLHHWMWIPVAAYRSR